MSTLKGKIIRAIIRKHLKLELSQIKTVNPITDEQLFRMLASAYEMGARTVPNE